MNKDIAANVIPSTIISFVLSFIVCGYIVPFPHSEFVNAINNGISGILSGGLSALVVTLLMYKKHRLKKAAS